MHSNVFSILMNIDATMPSGSGAISVYGGRHEASRPSVLRLLFFIPLICNLLINLFINQTHSL